MLCTRYQTCKFTLRQITSIILYRKLPLHLRKIIYQYRETTLPSTLIPVLLVILRHQSAEQQIPRALKLEVKESASLTFSSPQALSSSQCPYLYLCPCFCPAPCPETYPYPYFYLWLGCHLCLGSVNVDGFWSAISDLCSCKFKPTNIDWLTTTVNEDSNYFL